MPNSIARVEMESDRIWSGRFELALAMEKIRFEACNTYCVFIQLG